MRTITTLNGQELDLRGLFDWNFQSNEINVAMSYRDFIGYDLRSDLIDNIITYIECNAQYQDIDPDTSLDIDLYQVRAAFKTDSSWGSTYNLQISFSSGESFNIAKFTSFKELVLIFIPSLRELLQFSLGELIGDSKGWLVTNLYVEDEDGIVYGMFSSARLPRFYDEWDKWASKMLSHQKSLVEG